MTAIMMFSVSIGALSTACGSDGGDACSSDNDCKGDRICDGGECVSPDDGNNTNPNNTNPNNTNPNNTNPNNTNPNNTNPNNTNPNNTNPNNTNPNNTNPNNTEGSIGSECTDHSDCDSNYCRTAPGAFDGACAENDFGQTCDGNDQCLYNACIVNDPDVDIAGFCTATCESFTDCPTFWSCEELANAAGKYCIQD